MKQLEFKCFTRKLDRLASIRKYYKSKKGRKQYLLRLERRKLHRKLFGEKRYKQDLERKRERERLRYIKKRTELLSKKKIYRKLNADKIKVAKKRWLERNIVKSRIYRAKRRALERATIKHDERRFIEVMYHVAFRISNCLKIKHHVDHIQPLNCGGIHAMNNLQIIPAVFNLRKQDDINFKLPNCYQ